MIRFTLNKGTTDEVSYDFDDDRLMLQEAKVLEKVTGSRISEIHLDFLAGGATGISAYLWLAMRRADVVVKYNELDFDLSKCVAERLEPDVPPADNEDQADVDDDDTKEKQQVPTSAAA